METKAHYALVGFFAIALTAAAALFAVWLGQLRFNQDFREYDVVFQGPVRGLTESSEVRFNGIKVGEVTRLALDREDPSNVIARIRIAAETPVMNDSFAQLEPQGLTGLNYLQLSAGTPASGRLESRPGEVAQLAARQAALESILQSGESIAESSARAIDRFNDLLSPENVETISDMLENIRRLTDELAADHEDALIARARRTLEDLEAAAQDV